MLANVIATAAEAGHRTIDFSLDEYCDLFDLNTRSAAIRFVVSSNTKNRLKHVFFKAARELLFYIYFHLPAASKRIPLIGLFLEVVRAPSDLPFAIDQPPYSDRFFRRHKIFLLGDWFTRAPTYMARHRNLIASTFRMKPEVLASNDELEHQLRSEHDVLVGVVIRREDYKEFLNGRYYYSDEDYVQVLRKTQELFPNQKTGFFICSIDAEDLSAFSEFSVHHRHGHPMENLDFLGRCDYLLSPPSTYAMWASFIASKPLHLIEDPQEAIELDDFSVVNGLDA
jgi:hypothetical protein